MASPLVREKAVLGRIPTALSNSHASVAHPRDGRRARLAGSSDPGGVTSKRRLRPSSSPKASLVDINNLQGVKPSNLTSDTPLGSRPKRGQHFVGPDSRRGTVNRLIYATKKSAISLPLHLLFSSRGYTICLPFQKTAAMNSCQLLNALTLRVIRQICKFFNLFQDIILRFYAQSACYFSQQSLHAQIRPKFLYDHPHRRWSEILHWAILTHSVILLRSILLVTQPDKFYLNIYGPKIEPRRGATAFPHLLGIHDFVRLSLRLHALMSWPAELLDFLASPPEFVPLRHRRLPRRRGSSRSSKRLTEPLDPGRYPHPPSVPGDCHARDVL